ncbi:sugar phosphate permease [Pseudomonas alcaligenes]|nr:sugar phosphate permease [Pseudomonas alcaligenes]
MTQTAITARYSRNERGFWWAICNTSHNLGGALIPLLTASAAIFWLEIGGSIGILDAVRLSGCPAVRLSGCPAVRWPG